MHFDETVPFEQLKGFIIVNCISFYNENYLI